MAETAITFINRDLSWLEFNRRVLDEAQDPSVPLLERLKFLAITASNLDEFFMVRVGGLQQLVRAGKKAPDVSGLPLADQISEISKRVHDFVAAQYGCLVKDIEVQMAAQGIRRLSMDKLDPQQTKHLERVFEQEIYPVVTPVAIPAPESFPLLPGLGVNLCVRLAPPKEAEGHHRFAIIALPRKAARFIFLPGGEGHAYMTIEDTVRGFVDRFFPGNPIAECAVFRITRNAELGVREDLAGDLLEQMQEVLNERKESDCVRLEVSQGVSKTMMAFFNRALAVDAQDTYEIPGPIDLAGFFRMSMMAGFDALKYEPWPAQLPQTLRKPDSMFQSIARNDVLLFHPYESFDPVLRLIEQAADDPDVLAIKQILYRTSENSPVVAALGRAAERGKQVTAIVELKARFDEARNIEWAKALERSGVHVIYGIKGLKTHAKVCVIVRRETSGIRRYVHFGTGNYNEITARLYSDVSYMTSNEDYGADASVFFNTITGYSEPARFRKIEMSPLQLRGRLIELIDGEAQRSQQGQKGRIMARLNSLADPDVIRALCAASQAGVEIQLNVRGICCLRPGVQGVSENISVISIVDRFLEHSRILYFGHGGDPLVFISSADWMPRNLDGRIELLIPIEEPRCRDRLVRILETCLQDNVKARRLMPDGTYERVKPKGKKNNVRSQEQIYREACEAAKQGETSDQKVFEPLLPAPQGP